MAFRVGDRVLVRVAVGKAAPCRGKEATIIAQVEYRYLPYRVLVDGVPSGADDRAWGADGSELEPLTPPAEDTWAADAVKRVTKPHPDFQPSVLEVFEHYKSLQTD